MTDEVDLYKTNAYITSSIQDGVLLGKTNAYITSAAATSVLMHKSNAYITTKGNPNVLLTFAMTQVVMDEESNARLTYLSMNIIRDTTSNLRLGEMYQQVVFDTESHLRCTNMITQIIVPVVPEPPMSNIPFPGFGNSATNPSIPAAKDPAKSDLPGLTFSVHKIPNFKTNIQEAASGNEVRNSLMEYPRWEFQLEYEYIRDAVRQDGVNSLQKIMGLFLQMRGSWDTFLFKDPDDYLVTNNVLGIGDGLIVQYPFMRNFGGFNEIIGQVDEANSITVYYTETETAPVPPVAGPYTITVAHAADLVEDLGVKHTGGAALVKVAGAPASGQYSEAAGVYTFNAAQATNSMDITYRYLIDEADYGIQLPNLLVFDTAPPEDAIVSASFQFFFACRFVEDQLDFEKFMDKLWNLQQCNIKSVIQ